MRVEIDVQPLGPAFNGVSTYLRNVIGQFAVHHADVDFRFVADHDVPELGPAAVTRVGPGITNLKTKIVWETARLPVHTWSSRPDVLHLPYHSATAAGRGRRVLTVHDCYLWAFPPVSRGERVYRAMLAFAARRADMIVTDSDFSRRQITDLIGIDPERIRVVPLACAPDIARRRTASELRTLATRYGLVRPFVLYAGGTASYKGVLALVEAYVRMNADLRATTDLVVLGRLDPTVAHHKLILEAIAGLTGPGRIVTPGIVPQDELGGFYQAAQVFVFPSTYEGFGLSPLEAMACGTPVIASDRASIPEVVGDAAVLIDPSRAETITEALEHVLPDDDRLTAMQTASLDRAAHFTWERTAGLTRAAYEAALAR